MGGWWLLVLLIFGWTIVSVTGYVLVYGVCWLVNRFTHRNK
jgi:hypothetical protein